METGRRRFNFRKSTRASNNLKGSGDNCTNYSLKWNLQSQHILKELGRIYYCGGTAEEGLEGTDVTLFSREGDCVQAHKIVLMLCSPFFQKLFVQVNKAQRKERDVAVVVLGNVTTKQLRDLIRFLYTGEVDLASGREQEAFLEVAEQFGVEGLSTSRKPEGTRPPQKAVILRNKAVEHQRKGGKKEPPEAPVKTTLSEVGGNLGGGEEAVVEETSAPCKTEPVEDVALSEEGHEDFSQMEVSSNFSDSLQEHLISGEEDDEDISEDDRSKDPDVSFDQLKKSAPERKLGETDPCLSWRTGKLKGWLRIDPLSDEDLKRDWRKLNTIQGIGSTSKMYYCPYGGKTCPVVLKIKTLVDGTNLYFKNAYDHANHRGPDNCFGLTKEQKQFVIECLEKGITQPQNILFKFETSGLPRPQKLKLNNLLQRLKKKEGFGKYWTKKEPKWPRRIRKKPERDGPPKRRGRPSKEAKFKGSTSFSSTAIRHPPPSQAPAPAFPSVTSDSTSSSTVPSQSTLATIYPPPHVHPNHYLGQAFPFNPPPNYQFDSFR